MGGAVGFVRLRPASRVDPYSHRRRLSPRRMFRSNLSNIISDLRDEEVPMAAQTVKPLDRVVFSVCTPVATGVAKPLLNCDAPKAARLLKPLVRLRANRRDAMAVQMGMFRVLSLKALQTVLSGFVEVSELIREAIQSDQSHDTRCFLLSGSAPRLSPASIRSMTTSSSKPIFC